LLPFHEEVVHRLDDHYRIDFALSHRTGHDKIGSDLVVLGKATVIRTFVVFGAGKSIMLDAGSALTCSTATGVLMQPAIMILGLLLMWPARSSREMLLRGACGAMLLAVWLLLGIPLSQWIYFHDIPIRAYVSDEVSMVTAVGKSLLNGGGLILGALLAAGSIFLGRGRSGRLEMPRQR
jgi:hypothetical protein